MHLGAKVWVGMGNFLVLAGYLLLMGWGGVTKV